MYCNKCGKQIKDNAEFCPYCGTKIGIHKNNDDFSALVSSARNGDQDAVSALYEKTYSSVFYTIKSMIKDEDAVFDILQDSYIKAFTHLEQFEGNTKFLPWVRQIAANTARDWLKKKKPTLFAQLGTDDENDTPTEEQFADERNEHLPDQVIDQDETKRLIREIIDDLPEDQRAVIGMFYYEDMTVKEIAAAMGASESAVKSRLMYGRKKIETGVLELEKKGTKLYGLSPIPFLLLLFKNRKAYASELPNGQILQRVLENVSKFGATASAGAASGTAAGTAAAGTAAAGTAAGTVAGSIMAALGSLGAVKLAIIGITTAAVVGAGMFGGARLAIHSAEKRMPATTATPAPTTAAEPTAEPTPAALSPLDEAMEQYRIIINQASSYQYNPDQDFTPLGGYKYALVQMQSGDTVPTLLLNRAASSETVEGATDYINYVRVFKYDPDKKTVHQPTQSLMFGMTLMGGYRGGLGMASDGNGIYETDVSSGTGYTTFYRYTLNGDSLNKELRWEGRMDAMPSDLNLIEIEWHDIGDLSALDSLSSQGAQAADAPAAEPKAPDSGVTLPTDGNRIVLTGTVNTYSYNGVLDLQGYPDPNPGASSYKNRTFRLIVLDTPQTITVDSVDGMRSGKASIIDVSYADGLAQYDGLHVIFSIDPNNTDWPSDTSLPLGEPSTGDVHILN